MLTKILTLIIFIISVFALRKESLFYRLALIPYRVKREKEWWRVLSHAFIHADWMHLLINLYVFYSFGQVVELLFKYHAFAYAEIHFLSLFFGGIIIASIPALIKHRNKSSYIAVGASGTVSAIVFSYIIFQPLDPLRLLFIPFDIPAIFFGLAYLLYSFIMSRRAKGPIAHDAHFWGAIFGIVYTVVFFPQNFISFIEKILP